MHGIGKTRKVKDHIKGMNSMKSIKNKIMPKQKTVNYARFVADIRPQKYEPRIMILTAGGKRIEHDGRNSTETSGLETTKILVNSVISTPEARFGCFYISNVYLNTKLPPPEYMKIHVSMIPKEVME